MNIQDLKILISKMQPFDCGDNSCRFAKEKKGQRTNGGCRCIENARGLQRGFLVAAVTAIPELIAEIERLSKDT